MMDLHIIPECYIDTKLCKILVHPSTKYNHQKGCPNVAKVMKEKLKKDFALGIVDRDKIELAYFKEFTTVSEIPDSLQLCNHVEEKHHYLIFIQPAMEKWIISCADESNISLTDFNLPHDFKELLKITKTSKSENEDKHSTDFRDLFKELKRINSSSISILSFWIQYLRDTHYHVDIKYIRSETERLLSEI